MGFKEFIKSWKGITLSIILVVTVVVVSIVLSTQSDSSNQNTTETKDKFQAPKTKSPEPTSIKPTGTFTFKPTTTSIPSTKSPTSEPSTTIPPTTLPPLQSLPKKKPIITNLGPRKCPKGRVRQNGDRVFLTVDDGPSTSSRRHLLDVLKEINVGVSFFDCGYQVCNDLDTTKYKYCNPYSYEKNAKLLAETIKDGHFLGSHSDNHYINSKFTCQYANNPPVIRPKERLERCGNDPAQNMVQGAFQIETALKLSSLDWNTPEEKQLRDLALKYIWIYGRLPCSEVWRSVNYKHTYLPNIPQSEVIERTKVGNELWKGNIKCRPKEYQSIPWTLLGWDGEVDWKKETILNPNEVCRMMKLIESYFDKNQHIKPRHGKVVLLTHDFYFDTKERALIFQELSKELLRHGYELDTMDHYFDKV